MGGLGLSQDGAADELLLQHQVHHPQPGGLRLRTRCLHLAARHVPQVNQVLQQIIVFRCHNFWKFGRI